MRCGVVMIALLAVCLSADAAVKEKILRPGDRVPQSLILQAKNANALIVEKSSQTLHVYVSDGSGYFSRQLSFPCSTGEVAGMKREAGDKKTPEGVYFFIDEYEDRYLTPIYGKKAFPTDYPNFIDRQSGRNGSAIWLHGTNKVLKPMDSNGCVAMENDDILRVADYIHLGQTPVVMVETIVYVDRKEIDAERERLEKLMQGWVRALESGTYHEYLGFYDSSYLPDIAWWPGWWKIRQAVAERGGSFTVETSWEGLYREKDTFVLVVDISLSSGRGDVALGKRRLFVRKSNGHYTITGDQLHKVLPEKSQEPAEAPPTLVAAAQALAKGFEPGVTLQRLVNDWLKAWSTKDMKAYGNFYSSRFFSEDMNKKEWLERKHYLARKYRKIRVKGTDFRITEGPETGRVTFLQDYDSTGFSAIGEKTLEFIKENGEWKIFRETWKMK